MTLVGCAIDEPPDYRWAVEEHGATPVEAMAKAIVYAMREIW